ncbi:MAG: hypothetical protein KGH74_04600 [Candidatus Micrarchaeota archaeon]|nr:hypothetical protein [Candidatus Micrarchaeota archaeon]
MIFGRRRYHRTVERIKESISVLENPNLHYLIDEPTLSRKEKKRLRRAGESELIIVYDKVLQEAERHSEELHRDERERFIKKLEEERRWKPEIPIPGIVNLREGIEDAIKVLVSYPEGRREGLGLEVSKNDVDQKMRVFIVSVSALIQAIDDEAKTTAQEDRAWLMGLDSWARKELTKVREVRFNEQTLLALGDGEHFILPRMVTGDYSVEITNIFEKERGEWRQRIDNLRRLKVGSRRQALIEKEKEKRRLDEEQERMRRYNDPVRLARIREKESWDEIQRRGSGQQGP